MAPAQFAALKADFMAALAGGSELFVQDLYGGSQPEHRVCVRVVTELAWHSLFIRPMLIRPEGEELRGLERKSVVSGKSVSVRVGLGGRRSIKKKKRSKHNSESKAQSRNK